MSDSAGGPFVRVPPLGSLDAPEWRVERVWFTADLPGSEGELFRIVDAIFPGDSALVLADGGASALLFVDAGSATVRRVGREGDGPGEFRYLQHVLPHPSGDVLTYDGRLTRFDLAGEVVGTERLDPESVVSLRPLLQREDGTVAAVLGEQRIFGPGGEHRDTVPLMVFSTGASAPDTIATWLGLERAFASAPEGIYLVPIAFARTFFAAANLRRIAITSSDSLDVTIFSAQMAPLLRIVAPPEARGPSPAEVDEWRARMMAGVPDRSATLLRALESTPVRTRYPGLDGLVLDALDRLWVAEHPGMGVDRRRWLIFSAEGVPTGQVHLPWLDTGPLPGRTELLAAGETLLAVHRRNDFDEESVEIWRVYVSGALGAPGAQVAPGAR